MLQKSSNYLREVKVAIQMEDIYKDRVFNWDQAATYEDCARGWYLDNLQQLII